MNSFYAALAGIWCLLVLYADVLTDARLLPQCHDSQQGKGGKLAEFMIKSSVPYGEKYLPPTTAKFSKVLRE